MLIPMKFEVVKPPFNPDRSYYPALARKEGARELLPTSLDRFPYQPKLGGPHPALDGDEIMLGSIKGSIPPEHLSQIKDAFLRLVADLSIVRDVKLRVSRRHEEVRQGYIEFWLKTKLQELLKSAYLFDLKAKHAQVGRDIFRKIHAEAYRRHKFKDSLRLKLRDLEQAEVIADFDKAVLKGLEKIPQDLIISGEIIEEVLRALRETDPSRVMLAFRTIEENVMTGFADQLNDHVKQNIPNEILFSASAILRPHFSVHDTSTSQLMGELSYAHAGQVYTALAGLKHFGDQRAADQLAEHANPHTSSDILYHATVPNHKERANLETKILGEEAVRLNHHAIRELIRAGVAEESSRSAELNERRDQGIRAYWHSYDKENRPLRVTQMLSSTSETSQARGLNVAETSVVQRVLRAVATNQTAIHADKIQERLDGHVPKDILFCLSILVMLGSNSSLDEDSNTNDRGQKHPDAHPLSIPDRPPHHVKRYGRDEIQLAPRKSYRAEKDSIDRQIDSRSQMNLHGTAGKPMYWQIYDALHEADATDPLRETSVRNFSEKYLTGRPNHDVQQMLSAVRAFTEENPKVDLHTVLGKFDLPLTALPQVLVGPRKVAGH
jgi:hypothetical protein